MTPLPGNTPNIGIWNEIKGLKTETDISNKLNSLIKSLKSNLQNTEMETKPASIKEKNPTLLQQGRKAIGDAWTEGKRDISSRVQNLGIGRMLHTQSSKILDRLKENHKTGNKAEVKPSTTKNVTFAETLAVDIKPYSLPKQVDNLLQLAKKTEPGASPEELKEAGKNLFDFSTSLDTDVLKAISNNLKPDQLAQVVKGALTREIEQHTSAGNVLRANTTGNQLLGEFALSHLSKEFNNSEALQSLLKGIPKETLTEGPGFNESAIPQAKNFMNEYFNTTKSLLEGQSEEMNLFKSIIKDTASSIDNKFGSETGAGATAGVNLLFLRVLNPIIISPEAKGLTLTDKREGEQTKNAVLFVKIAQNMANNIEYKEDSKEAKMVVFNPLLGEQQAKMLEVKGMLVS